ncbi:MAG: class I SAM-dependent methyltransferase [Chlamydiales bacterium]
MNKEYFVKQLYTDQKEIVKQPFQWKKIGEFFSLAWVNLKFGIYSSFEYIKTVFRYYRHIPFMLSDLSLLSYYVLRSPYRISKHFLTKRGEEEVYTYGETPLTTLDYIVKTCDLKKADTIYELGCGRGRTCFWLAQVLGCNTVGIEYLPEFVQHANAVKKRFHVENLEFLRKDLFDVDLSQASHIYLYLITMKDSDIERLAEKCAELKPGTAIITVSFPLCRYSKQPVFEIMKCFPAQFPWGEAQVFLQYRK